ncbi:hypothetical protein AAZV13_15G133400 [Glycine max]
MISGRSFYALSAPRITTSFPSVATLTTTTLSKPKTGFVCPICGKKVGVDLVGHFTTQHGNFLRVQRKRRVRKGGSASTISILRKELQEGALQSLLGGSSYLASSNSEPDPLLSSFMFNPVVADESVSATPPSTEDALVKESSKDDFLKRKPQQLQLSEEDQVEKARRFEFVQGLLMSTILDDKL